MHGRSKTHSGIPFAGNHRHQLDVAFFYVVAVAAGCAVAGTDNCFRRLIVASFFKIATTPADCCFSLKFLFIATVAVTAHCVAATAVAPAPWLFTLRSSHRSPCNCRYQSQRCLYNRSHQRLIVASFINICSFPAVVVTACCNVVATAIVPALWIFTLQSPSPLAMRCR